MAPIARVRCTDSNDKKTLKCWQFHPNEAYSGLDAGALILNDMDMVEVNEALATPLPACALASAKALLL